MSSNASSALIDYALPKWQADPGVQIEDAYKWLYQATRGAEHMVPRARAAAETLEKEWISVGSPREGEVVWEPLRHDGKIGRLHLRPFKDAGGKIGDLAAAFVASSEAYKVDPAILLSAWNELGQRLEARSFGQLVYGEWGRLDVRLRPANYPAIHHSDRYRLSRQPAYRILIVAEARRLLGHW